MKNVLNLNNIFAHNHFSRHIHFLKNYIVRINYNENKFEIFDYGKNLLKQANFKHSVNRRAYPYNFVNKYKLLENNNFIQYYNRMNNYILDIESLVKDDKYKEYNVNASRFYTDEHDNIMFFHDMNRVDDTYEYVYGFINNQTRKIDYHEIIQKKNTEIIATNIKFANKTLYFYTYDDKIYRQYIYNFENKEKTLLSSQKKMEHKENNLTNKYYDPCSDSFYNFNAYSSELLINSDRYLLTDLTDLTNKYSSKLDIFLTKNIISASTKKNSMYLIDIKEKKIRNYKFHNITYPQFNNMQLQGDNLIFRSTDSSIFFLKINIYDETYFETIELETYKQK